MKHKVAMPEAANKHKKIVSKKHQIFIESFYVSFLDEKKKMFFSLYKTDRIKKNTKKTQVESCRWMLSSWVLNQQQDATRCQDICSLFWYFVNCFLTAQRTETIKCSLSFVSYSLSGEQSASSLITERWWDLHMFMLHQLQKIHI